jgi:uncharacterized protein
MTNASDNIEANKAIVRNFLAVFSTGNVAGILDGLEDDATWWVSGKLPGLSGTYSKADLGPLLKGATALYTTGALRITPLDMIAEGNRVAVEAESYAELTDGRVYNNLYHFVVEIRNGRIGRVKEYMDTHHANATFLLPKED